MPARLTAPLILTAPTRRGVRLANPPAPDLPTHRTLTIGGVPKRLPVAYFWKDAISTGRYVHPLTGQKFRVDRERIDRWVHKFHRMTAAGVEVPTPVDHSESALDNLGFVVDARREGDTLKLLHQAMGERAAVLATRNRCSVLIDPDFRDGHGKAWGEVIAHSSYTPKPVVHGHGEFVAAFSASRAGGRRKRRALRMVLSRSSSPVAAGDEPRPMSDADLRASALGSLRREQRRAGVEAERVAADTARWCARKQCGGGVLRPEPSDAAGQAAKAHRQIVTKLVSGGYDEDHAEREAYRIERDNAARQRTRDADEARRGKKRNPFDLNNPFKPTALGQLIGLGGTK